MSIDMTLAEVIAKGFETGFNRDVTELLREAFPWLQYSQDTDISGIDTIERLQEIYNSLGGLMDAEECPMCGKSIDTSGDAESIERHKMCVACWNERNEYTAD
jgi:hypothetical protein